MGPDKEFDMAGAVDEVGSGLGFEEGGSGVDPDVHLEVEAPAGGASAGEAGETPATTAGSPDPADPPPEGQSDPDAPPAFVPREDQKRLFNEDGTLRTWRKEAAAEFPKLPPVVQAEILKREEDIHRGLEEYREAATFGTSMRTSIAPYLPILQQHGIDPGQQTARLFQVQHGLVFGTPEQKQAIVLQIAKDYGVDVTALALEAPYVDPQVAALQNQVTSVQSRLEHQEAAVSQAKQAELRSKIDAFCTDPANVYIDEVVNDMAYLLKTGRVQTVEDAYKEAIWLNPVVRAKEVARQNTERAAAEAADKAKKLEAAKKASSANVRSKGKGGSAATPLGSMDDTLNEALAQIQGRSS